MKENQDKSHFLSRIDKNSRIKLPNGVVNRSEQKKLPDIIIDTKLNFFYHASHICNKVCRNMHAPAKSFSYILFRKCKTFMKNLE